MNIDALNDRVLKWIRINIRISTCFKITGSKNVTT